MKKTGVNKNDMNENDVQGSNVKENDINKNDVQGNNAKENVSKRQSITRFVCAVTGRMLFLGFTIQIILGIVWMCGNFTQVQNFGWHNLGRTESGEETVNLIQNIYEFLGKAPGLVFACQLGLGFAVGYLFLTRHVGKKNGADKRRQRRFAVWGSLALLTFPFAMQCHLAVLPYSVMASLFLLMLSFLLELNEKRKLKPLLSAIMCGVLALVLSGSVNADEREAIWGRGPEAALASRMAWPSIWNDYGSWSEKLREMTEDAVREASYYPGNMEILLQAIEEEAGPQAAKDYYMEIAGIGWDRRAYMVVRQIGWDILGYGVTPLIVPLQLEGRAYDSYTGRNYEIMQEHTPVLTRYYIDYGCWWFGCSLALTVLQAGVLAAGGGMRLKDFKKLLIPASICIVAAGIPVALYTMRGAGLMDYRCTVGINQLWLILGLAGAAAGGKTQGPE